MILHWTQVSPLVVSDVCYQDFNEGVEQCQTLVSVKIKSRSMHVREPGWLTTLIHKYKHENILFGRLVA